MYLGSRVFISSRLVWEAKEISPNSSTNPTRLALLERIVKQLAYYRDANYRRPDHRRTVGSRGTGLHVDLVGKHAGPVPLRAV